MAAAAQQQQQLPEQAPAAAGSNTTMNKDHKMVWAAAPAPNVSRSIRHQNNQDQDDSWEVRAFAEDAASCSGQWPPRSYTCSFCGREFRTAQALGGHMNVHRRERAYANQLGLSMPTNKSAAANNSSSNNNNNNNNPHSSPICPASVANSSSVPPPPPAPAGNHDPPPALGFCWVYPYNPAARNHHPHHHHQFQQGDRDLHHHHHNFVFPPPIPPPPPIFPQNPTHLPQHPGSSIVPELSLSPPVPDSNSSLNSSSTSDNSSTGSGSLPKIHNLGPNPAQNHHQQVQQQPDLSGMRLIVVGDAAAHHHYHHMNSVDLELRLGHSSTI